MLQRLVTWVLNTYLGRYLESVHVHQLSVGVLSGAIQLENVPLRRDALAGLDTPLCVKTGFVGKVRLRLPPLRRLLSEPWSITVEQLYVVLGPLDPRALDVEQELEVRCSRKMARLEAEETAWRQQHEPAASSSYYAYSYSSWLEYGSAMVAGIVANLQLLIRDVHVRYEHAEVAAGVTLSSLTTQSCDSRWTAVGGGREAGCGGTSSTDLHSTDDEDHYKVIQLQRLDVYWDALSEPLAGLDPPDLAVRLMAGVGHHYLMEPVTLEARWRRSGGPPKQQEESVGRPRHSVQLQCSRLAATFSSTQLSQAVKLARCIETLQKQRNHLHLRPRMEPVQAPRIWWRYAALCHLQTGASGSSVCSSPGRFTWSDAAEAARELVEYSRLYSQHLRCPATLSGHQMACKHSIELVWSEQRLRCVQEWCRRRVVQEEGVSAPEEASSSSGTGGLLRRWFPTWTGWYEQHEELEVADADSQLQRQLVDSLEQRGAHFSLLCSLHVQVMTGELQLLQGPERSGVCCLQLRDFEGGVEVGPGCDKFRLRLQLGSLLLLDRSASNSAFPRLVAPHCGSRQRVTSSTSPSSTVVAEEDLPLFRLVYEHNRPTSASSAERVLHVTSRSLEVVYSSSSVVALQQFARLAFLPPSDTEMSCGNERSTLPDLSQAARDGYCRTRQQFLDSSASSSSVDWARWEVRLEVAVPLLLIPDDPTDPDSLLLIVDLGSFTLTNYDDVARQSQGVAAKKKLDDDESDADDDEFITPCSSPPPEPAAYPSLNPTNAPATTLPISSDQLRHCLRHCVSLQLQSAQVLVAFSGEQWRGALTCATSRLHVLDRLSLHVRVEWPTPAAAAALVTEAPRLSITVGQLLLHISEQKTHAIGTLVNGWVSVASTTEEDSSSQSDNVSDCDRVGFLASLGRFDCDLRADRLCVAVESCGRALAELQVVSVLMHVTRSGVDHQSCDVRGSLSVARLLLVDALQCYGPDYEVLLTADILESSGDTTQCVGRGETMLQHAISLSFSNTGDGSAQEVALKLASINIIANRTTIVALVTFFTELLSFQYATKDHNLSLPLDLSSVSPKENSWFSLSPVKAQPSALESGGGSGSSSLSAFQPPLSRNPPSRKHINLHGTEFQSHSVEYQLNKLSRKTDSGFVGDQSRQSDNVSSAGLHPINPASVSVNTGQSVSSSDVLSDVRLLVNDDEDDKLSFGRAAPELMDGGSDSSEQHGEKHWLPNIDFSLDSITILLIDEGAELTATNIARLTIAGVSVTRSADHVQCTTESVQLHNLLKPGSRRTCVLSVGDDPLCRQLYGANSRSALSVHWTQTSLQLHALAACFTHSQLLLTRLSSCVRQLTASLAELCPAGECSGSVSGAASDLHVLCELEQPVLAVPEMEASDVLLVLHLNKLTTELHLHPSTDASSNQTQAIDLSVSVTDANVYSLNVARSLMTRRLSVLSVEHLLSPHRLYDVSACGDPLLYSTSLTLGLSRDYEELWNFQCDFTTPVRLSLQREQYRQITTTIDWLSTGDSGIQQPGDTPRSTSTSSTRLSGHAMVPHIELELCTHSERQASNRALASLAVTAVEFVCDTEGCVKVSLAHLSVEDLTQDPQSTQRMLVICGNVRRGSTLGRSNSYPSVVFSRPPTLSKTRWCSWPDLQTSSQSSGLVGSLPGIRRALPPVPASLSKPLRIEVSVTGVKLVFGRLHVVIAPHSWLILLDFFCGVHLSANNNRSRAPVPVASRTTPAIGGGSFSWSVRVARAHVLLHAGGSGPLARVSVRQLRGGIITGPAAQFSCEGQLNRLTVDDLSLAGGQLYRRRLSVGGARGHRVLRWRLDEHQLRVSCPPLCYVHIQRLVGELCQFVGQCNQLIDRLQEMGGSGYPSTSPPASRQSVDVDGLGIPSAPSPASRRSVDVQSVEVLLLLPVHATSQQTLVLAAKEVQVKNSDAAHGVQVCVRDLDVFTGSRVNGRKPPAPPTPTFSSNWSSDPATTSDLTATGFYVVGTEGHLLDRLVSLCVHVQTDGGETGVVISGCVSDIVCRLSLSQYHVIRGMFEWNFAEPASTTVSSTLLDCTENVTQSSHPATTSDGMMVTVQVELRGVCIQLVGDHATTAAVLLARADIRAGRLVYDVAAGGSRHLAVEAQRVQLVDTRSSQAAVIVQKLPVASERGVDRAAAAIELHYRVSVGGSVPDGGQFCLMLSGVSVLAVTDWWAEVAVFLSSSLCLSAISASAATESIASGDSSVSIGVLAAASSSSTTATTTPVPIRVGVLTRRAPPLPADSQLTLQMKLLVTGCCLVLPQQSEGPPSSTSMVLRAGTLCVHYRPSAVQKPLSCELQQCSLLQCCTSDGLPQLATGLTIVEPFTLSMDVAARRANQTGIGDIHDAPPTVYHTTVTSQQVVIRVSRVTASTLMLAWAQMMGAGSADVLEPVGSSREPVAEPGMLSSALQRLSVHVSGVTVFGVANGVAVARLSLQQCLLRCGVCHDDGGGSNGAAEDSTAAARLSLYYYNRSLSGWEPVVEPTRCWVKWRPGFVSAGTEPDSVNVNITSDALSLARALASCWMSEQEEEGDEGECASRVNAQLEREKTGRLSLINRTGCCLRFCREERRLHDNTSTEWLNVESGNRVLLQDTPDAHWRVVLCPQGWQPSAAVSLHRLGTFFRHCRPQPGSRQPTVRVVVDVELDGATDKLVTVRSALVLANQLPLPVTVSCGLSRTPLCLAANSVTPVPFHWLHVPLSVCVCGEGAVSACYHPPYCWWRSADVFSVVCGSRQFCIERRQAGYPNSAADEALHPGHLLTLLPALAVENMLPCELHFSVHQVSSSPVAEGSVVAGGCVSLLHTLSESAAAPLYLSVSIDGFRADRPLGVGAVRCGGESLLCTALEDDCGRRLLLAARLSCWPSRWYRVSLSAPYWLQNDTGLPLVAGQEAAEPAESAGQHTDHERARSMAPLLFSLSDAEAPHALVLRLGRGLHGVAGVPRWSTRIPLQAGAYQRRLRVTPVVGSGAGASQSGTADWVYEVAVVVRPGSGRYRHTHIISITPRYQLINRTVHRLWLTQAALVENTAAGTADHALCAMPAAQTAFHWPRHELPHLMCARDAECEWSGAFSVTHTDSFCVNLRDSGGGCRLLRVEVAAVEGSGGAALFILLLDASALPPPMLVHNTSSVSVTFRQSGHGSGSGGWSRGVVRPNSRVAYCWDRLLAPAPRCLTLTAPGGHSHDYDPEQMGEACELVYDRLLFVAMTVLPPVGQPLVLDVASDGCVLLRAKQSGARSQLWRQLDGGQLAHEGSCPPGCVEEQPLVLDIAASAVQPFVATPLCVRKLEPRRRLTQTWRICAETGRLCCLVSGVHATCRQLADGSPVVLLRDVVDQTSDEEAGESPFSVQLLPQWSGSGRLAVRVYMDGPTRVVSVSDALKRCVRAGDEVAGDSRSVSLQLTAGLSISLVCSRMGLELLCAHLIDVRVDVCWDDVRTLFDASVARWQVDCHLPDTEAPVLLYCSDVVAADRPAFIVSARFQRGAMTTRVPTLRHLTVHARDIVLTLEERLLYHLLLFFSEDNHHQRASPSSAQRRITASVDPPDTQLRPSALPLDDTTSLRYYVSRLEVALRRVCLSVLTSPRLSRRLSDVRQGMAMRLVQFENAHVELDRFVRTHVFETARQMLDSLLEHFREELKSQAATILVSTDFLGNPLGFFNDVSEGMSSLLGQGDVSGLLMNVTHGVANSAAKMTGSLSDVVGWASLDERHDERRRRLRQRHAASQQQLSGGVKALGLGLWGGASSLLVQPVQGAADAGLWGLVTGVGRGIVGTVTKPAVGLLDLAAGTANALRSTSGSGAHPVAPSPLRPGRVVRGPCHLLPVFSLQEARAQQRLLRASDLEPDEHFVAGHSLQRFSVLLSSRRLRVYRSPSNGGDSVELSRSLLDVGDCVARVRPAVGGAAPSYLVALRVDREPIELSCSNDTEAVHLARLINQACAYCHELLYSLPEGEDGLLTTTTT